VVSLAGNGDNHDVVSFRKTAVMGRRLLLDMKKLRARKQYEQSRLDMMLRYASTRECRRKLMLGYFGESYDVENCGACDNCIKKLADTSVIITTIQQPAVHVPTVPFRSGDVVAHRKWGEGRVQNIESSTVTVHFPDIGYKTLALDLVVNSGLLQAVAH
jgi:ATP-dependent DNA helicase RecQ